MLGGVHARPCWDTVLRKHYGYGQVFFDFDIAGVVVIGDAALKA